MDRRHEWKGLRWIADAYPISFTLTLSEGLSPHELLRSLDAEKQHVVPLTRSAALELLTRDEEDHISDLEFLDWEDEAAVARLTDAGFLPAPPDTIVRAGAVAGWAYALEEFHCRTGAYLAALSQRGRAFLYPPQRQGLQPYRVRPPGRAGGVLRARPAAPHPRGTSRRGAGFRSQWARGGRRGIPAVPGGRAGPLASLGRDGGRTARGRIRLTPPSSGHFHPRSGTAGQQPAQAKDRPSRHLTCVSLRVVGRHRSTLRRACARIPRASRCQAKLRAGESTACCPLPLSCAGCVRRRESGHRRLRQ